MTSISIDVRTSAKPDTVWEVLIDSAGWADWADPSSSVRLTEGQGHPDGVGSVRSIWVAGLVEAREEVITFDEANHVYAYKGLSGLPVKDHVGTVTLTEDNGGTMITWAATNRPLLPIPGAGQVNRVLFSLVFKRTASALAREAERRS